MKVKERINNIEIFKYALSADPEASYIGDDQGYIEGFASLDFLHNSKMAWIRGVDSIHDARCFADFHDLLLICGKEVYDYLRNEKDDTHNYIITGKPRDIFFSVLSYFYPPMEEEPFDNHTSVILSETMGSNVKIGYNCYICKDVVIDDNVTIHNNVVIECPAVIGSGTVIHSGVVIGADGYGYYNENGLKKHIPHYGRVIIGNDVEIGANTCIDRGCLSDTVIGDNTKIDNLVHIAHNVHISSNCMVVAQAMVAGSSTIGENTYVAPGALVIDQSNIGDNSTIGMGAVVIRDVPDNDVVVGNPAHSIKKKIQ